MDENPYEAPAEHGHQSRSGLAMARRALPVVYLMMLLAVAVALDQAITWKPGYSIIARVVVCASLSIVPVTIAFLAGAFFLWLADNRSA